MYCTSLGSLMTLRLWPLLKASFIKNNLNPIITLISTVSVLFNHVLYFSRLPDDSQTMTFAVGFFYKNNLTPIGSVEVGNTIKSKATYTIKISVTVFTKTFFSDQGQPKSYRQVCSVHSCQGMLQWNNQSFSKNCCGLFSSWTLHLSPSKML